MSAKSLENTVVSSLSIKKQILFTSIIVIGFLLLGEAGIRTWAHYFRTSYEHYNRQTGRLELVPNLHYRNQDGHEFRINSRGFVGPEFDETPPAGTTRIIAVGDSCTFTLGLWEMAYPAVAERQLNSQGVLGRVEYINAGIEGYNSQFALARIKEELLQYKPQIVTIYIGWNDLMKQNPESQAEVGEPSVIAEVINESYLVKAYTRLMFVIFRPFLFQPKIESDEVDRHAYDRYVPKRYELNLHLMISELKRKGVKVILFTLPTVLEPGMTADDLKKRGVFFPYYAGSFSVDRLLSLHAAYNRTIRNVGMDEQVPVVDLDAEFKKLELRPLFWDTMHPSEKGNAVIADLVASQITLLLNK
jgi:lysophospholipase L1-like esterase